MKRTSVVLALGLVLASLAKPDLVAQTVCPASAAASTLICVIPQLYGPGGLTLPNPFHSAHFNSDFEASFTPLNAALGVQLTLLPIASPASGYTFSFDPSLGVFTRSAEGFGPLLSERAETIGHHKLYIGFTYQHFAFGSIDGVDLHKLSAVYTHIDCCNPNGTTRQPGDAPSPGSPAFEQDFITTANNVDLTVNQFTLFATFGLTNRVDISAAFPIMNVSLGVVSNAHIVRNSQPSPTFGFAHYFDPACIGNIACQAASTQKTFSNFGEATGIGDIILRGKASAWKGERSGVAVGADVRLPSGDELNFLGSGAPGIRPFVAFSYRAKISPHVNLGYEWNGESILAGDLITGTKGKLPDLLSYSAGVDYVITRRMTAAVDFLGQRIFAADRAHAGPYTDIIGQVHPDIQQTTIVTGSYNTGDLAVGGKISPWGNLLVSGNLLIRLNDGGLRSNVVPLVGLSYTF